MRITIASIAHFKTQTSCFLSERNVEPGSVYPSSSTLTMSSIEILKFPISSPGDLSPLKGLKDAGYDPSQIVAIVGKTEGTFELASRTLHKD